MLGWCILKSFWVALIHAWMSLQLMSHKHNGADLLSQSEAFQFHHRFLCSWNRIGEMNFYFGFIFTHYSCRKEDNRWQVFTAVINSRHYTCPGSKRKQWHNGTADRKVYAYGAEVTSEGRVTRGKEIQRCLIKDLENTSGKSLAGRDLSPVAI